MAADSAIRSTSSSNRVATALFGHVDGVRVDAYTLSNGADLEVTLLTYGGILQAINVPDRDGTVANVGLGFKHLDEYVAAAPYFGAMIGRYANRIAKGRFGLDGQTYQLATNNGANALHGGAAGFDKRVWEARVEENRDGPTVVLSRLSPDGEERYPGNLQVDVTYTVTSANGLRISYRAVTDQPTIINMTNHSYFNLGGEGSGTVYDHELALNAGRYTPVDKTSIPTGEIATVTDTPMDFTSSRRIGERVREQVEQLVFGRGYDHNFVLDRAGAAKEELVRGARLRDPFSGRVMEILTTEPGLQLYTGNLLDGTIYGTSDRAYRQGEAIALETQHFPDSPNQPNFPSTVLLPGEEFNSTTVYAFSVD